MTRASDKLEQALRQKREGGDSQQPSAPQRTSGGAAQRRQQAANPVAFQPEPTDPSLETAFGEPNDLLSQALRGATDTGAMAGDLVNLPASTVGRALGVDVPSPPDAQQVAERSGGMIATEEPQTMLGRAVRFGGAAIAGAPLIGGGAAAVPRSMATGGSVPRRVGRFIRNQVAEGGQAFRQQPGRFVAGEGVAGAGAGATGFFVEQAYPESDAAQVVAELAGGVLAQGPLIRLGAGAARRGRDAVQGPFRESGARGRAAQAIQGAQTRAEQGQVPQALDQPTTIDPQTGEPVLTPAQRSDTIGLPSVERSVRESRPDLAREREEQLARANQVIQQEARDIAGEGTPADTAATLEEGQRNLLQRFNQNMRRIGQRIDRRIRNMGAGASREDANEIARQEVEEARRLGSRAEKRLFRQVDPDVAVPSTTTQETLAELSDDLAEDQIEDIPARARRRLNPESDNFIGDTTNVREMRGLQSKLREESRIARSNQQFNKARIADDLADAITDDLSAASGQSEALDRALTFSRAFRERFRRGAVGKILGRDRTGGQAVREGETLEQTIGGGGPGARGAMDEIRRALTDPQLTPETGTDATAFNEAANQFIRQRFIRESVTDGEFNPNSAQNFLRRNDEILSRMPQVREEIEQTIREGNIQRLMARRRQSTKTNVPSVSRATLFIQKGPQQAFSEITGEAPDRAARQTQQLLNRAKRDRTGRAVSGLKRGYVDFLMRPSRQRDVQGVPTVDGFALRDLRSNPSIQAAERRLLSEGERKRLNTIQQDLIRLQRSREASRVGRGSDDLPVADQPGKIRQRIARIVGAGVGRQTAAATGSGGTVQIPGQVADMFNDMVNAGFEDPAGMMLRSAVDDEQLFRALDAEVQSDGTLPRKARNRLNAWVAGVIAEHQQGDTPEEPTQAPQSDLTPQQKLQRAREAQQ